MALDKTKTKIVCTIGPSTSSKHVLRRLASAGMNVARLNLSHGVFSEHVAVVRRIRDVSRKLRTPIGILADLPGPRVRVGKVFPEPVILRGGSQLTLTGRKILGNHRIVTISHPSVVRELHKGDSIFLADGTIRLTVHGERRDGRLLCRVVRGGRLFSGKGVNIPGRRPGVSALTGRDVQFLRALVQNDVEFVGLSFITSASDVLRARRIVDQLHGQTWVIAKIEKRQAVDNFDDIVRIADGVMVARGDLGVEMEVEDVPIIQKQLIQKANAAGKPVITATQMLESMVNNPTPTRAEVTDIANAVIDGTDAVMLSEETAVGKYPVEAVKMMKRVADVTERNLPYRELLDSRRKFLKTVIQDAISFSACEVAYELGAECIVAHTRAGTTAHRVSKFRASVPILALTHSTSVMNRLSLLWGVYPYRVRRLSTTAEIFTAAKAVARKSGMVGSESRIVVVCGDPSTVSGTTDLLRVQVT